MEAKPIHFAGSGVVENDAMLVVGMAYVGFTSVVVYDGVSASPLASPVLVGGAAGTYNTGGAEVLCPDGVYIVVAGSGSGTLWVSG